MPPKEVLVGGIEKAFPECSEKAFIFVLIFYTIYESLLSDAL